MGGCSRRPPSKGDREVCWGHAHDLTAQMSPCLDPPQRALCPTPPHCPPTHVPAGEALVLGTGWFPDPLQDPRLAAQPKQLLLLFLFLLLLQEALPEDRPPMQKITQR